MDVGAEWPGELPFRNDNKHSVQSQDIFVRQSRSIRELRMGQESARNLGVPPVFEYSRCHNPVHLWYYTRTRFGRVL